ncbi:hypothetical protein CMI47_18910 [Candidatus Pacearchaeota archaeon]|nr:hypothetical protein [Candidatus Pacearchaeota archaeon]|tara:strand:+ start:21177 stop:21587 length:411 start_codon:yes stop_codon:yes gene_type:complete
MKTLLDLIENKKFIECRGDRQSTSRIIESAVGMPSMTVPITAATSTWQILSDPERLVKNFQFSDIESVRYFINELLSEQKRIHHDVTMTVSSLSVTIETFTHDVNSVTSQDKRISQFCDEIYEDTKHFNLKRNDQY